MVGPTAVGKSEVAVEVADALGAEVISADSMQVYRGMDVGTAKLRTGERRGIVHHLLDVVEPSETFSVADHQAAALDLIGSRPDAAFVLVGGTGLYVQAIVDGLELPGRYPEARAAVEAEADTAALHRRLLALDPVAAGRMEANNRRRVVRALEVTLGSGRPFSSFGPGLEAYPSSRWRLAGLDLPSAVLDRRIEERVDHMLAAGLVEETEALLGRPGGLSATARQALGYREVLLHLEEGVGLAQVRDLIVSRTRRFARRQRSWFRRDPRVRWHDADAKPVEVAGTLLEDWGLS